LQDGADHGWAVVFHRYEQLVEEALIGEATDLGTTEPVDLIDLAKKRERSCQGVFDAAVDGEGSVEHAAFLLQFDYTLFGPGEFGLGALVLLLQFGPYALHDPG